ncbi:MAG: transposase [Candidatus Brocadiales bacterium]|nr:transposase [Candidatus Brocadiales bacterium]
MRGQETLGWNIFKEIFSDNWDGFKKDHSRYDTKYYDGLVEKMLSCGNPEEMGYIEYLCQSCGDGRRLVPMSCKSTLCLRCGKVYVDNWVSQVSKMLHNGVIYRHIVLTMPDNLRSLFYKYSVELYGKFFSCGAKCLDDFFGEVRGKALKGGYLIVLQTNGRNGQYNPHLHIISTSGGLDEKNNKWEHLDYLPFSLLHKKWQWYLLEMLKKEIGTEEAKRLVDECYKRYPNGFVANVQKGAVPSRYNSLARYLAKYVVSPPISIRRIDSYDGENVTYHYHSHKTKREEQESVDVYTFIGRMIQHVFPKGFQRIRYYGVQATKTFEKIKGIIQKSLLKVKRVVKSAVKIIEEKSYRERYWESFDKDPFRCIHCGGEMVIWTIYHPRYGVIYDENKVIMSGKYEQREEEINSDEYNRRSIRSSTERIQLSLFGV